MKSMQNVIRSIPGFFEEPGIACPFDHTRYLILKAAGKSPTGLQAICLSFEERSGGIQQGPQMLLEIGDLAWYPFEYREPGLLFPFCVYRKEKAGRLSVDFALKRQLMVMAQLWDQELLQYHLTA